MQSYRKRSAERDSGFTLVEVLVAISIFAVLAASVAALLLRSLDTTRTNRARLTASNLASRELEIARAEFSSPSLGPKSLPEGQVINYEPLPGGTAGAPLVVDSLAYTVTRTSEWQSQGAASGPCDGGASGQLAYLRVSVEVGWANMGNSKPVVASTLLTPPAGTYAAGTGHVKVKVLDQDGVPEANLPVSLAGPGGSSSQLTADDGCAFFAFLTPGVYTASIAQPGYVDGAWIANPSLPATVTANTVYPVGFAYAPAAPITLTVAPFSGGYPLALSTAAGVGVPVTLYNTAFLNSTKTLTLPTAAVTNSVARNVFPYPAGVVVWAGSCLDADPQVLGASNTRDLPVPTEPGAPAVDTALTGPVQVIVKRAGVVQTGLTVIASHAIDAGCPGPVTDTAIPSASVGTYLKAPVFTDAAGMAKFSLPFGSWTFKVVGKQASSAWVTQSIIQGTSMPTVNLAIQ